MGWYTCNVKQAGPLSNDGSRPNPAVFINLQDDGGNWEGGLWFYAADNCKDQMLAVALRAISTGRKVSVSLEDPPNQYTIILRLYLIA